ncbi:hypothetical protein ACFE04_009560 [Oxalis oulophora]
MANKNKGRSKSNPEDLQLAKSAAMAWHNRGTKGEDNKPMRNFDQIKRTSPTHKPSRYKLEASRRIEEGASSNLNNSRLLDRYEVASISKRLEYYIASSRPVEDEDIFEERSSNSTILKGNDPISYYKDNLSLESMFNKKKIFKIFWPRNALVCGTIEDVNTRALVCGNIEDVNTRAFVRAADHRQKTTRPSARIITRKPYY